MSALRNSKIKVCTNENEIERERVGFVFVMRTYVELTLLMHIYVCNVLHKKELFAKLCHTHTYTHRNQLYAVCCGGTCKCMCVCSLFTLSMTPAAAAAAAFCCNIADGGGTAQFSPGSAKTMQSFCMLPHKNVLYITLQQLQ